MRFAKLVPFIAKFNRTPSFGDMESGESKRGDKRVVSFEGSLSARNKC